MQELHAPIRFKHGASAYRHHPYAGPKSHKSAQAKGLTGELGAKVCAGT